MNFCMWILINKINQPIRKLCICDVIIKKALNVLFRFYSYAIKLNTETQRSYTPSPSIQTTLH